AIDPSPDPAAPPTSALTILLVEKTTPTDMNGQMPCVMTCALEGIPKRLAGTAAPAIVAATVRAAPYSGISMKYDRTAANQCCACPRKSRSNESAKNTGPSTRFIARMVNE